MQGHQCIKRFRVGRRHSRAAEMAANGNSLGVQKSDRRLKDHFADERDLFHEISARVSHVRRSRVPRESKGCQPIWREMTIGLRLNDRRLRCILTALLSDLN